jgi:hypothetical protein
MIEPASPCSVRREARSGVGAARCFPRPLRCVQTDEQRMMAKQSKKPAYRDGDEMIVPSAASPGTGKLNDEEFGEKPIPSEKQTPPKAGQSAVARRSSEPY